MLLIFIIVIWEFESVAFLRLKDDELKIYGVLVIYSRMWKGNLNGLEQQNKTLSPVLTFNYKTVTAQDQSFYLTWHL